MSEQVEEVDVKTKNPFRWLRWTVGVLLLGLLGGVGVAHFVLWQGARFEDLQDLEAYKPKLYTRIYDRNGVLLATISKEKRIILDFEDMPKDFVNAMVALEDEAFFSHIGVSPMGILAALKDNLMKGTMRGASTLTQQLVKNITKDKRASYQRKLKEQFLAVQLESRFTKEEIFAMYGNEVPFGNNQFGLAAAGKYYFDKSVGQLTLAECATIAGLPQAPSYFNPYRHPERATRKRNVVLLRMFEEGYIDEETYKKTCEEPLVLRRKGVRPRQTAAHFIDKVRGYLFEKYGEETVRTSAWDVYTTLDVRYQSIAEDAVQKALKEKDKTLGYRHYDCPSVYKKDEENPEDVLDTYFDTSWRKNFQVGVNIRGVVMAVEEARVEIRVKDERVWITQENMPWIKKIKDMNRYFKVGDVPLFMLTELPEPPPEPEVEEDAEELNPTEEDEAAAEAEAAAEVLDETDPEAVPEEVIEEEEIAFPFMLMLDQEPDIEGAFMAVDPNSGDMLAMVGGYDYRRSKFNRAEQAKRQVGSSIKPVIFGAALEQGYTLSDLLVDEPTMFWDPTQFQLEEDGTLELYKPHSQRARKIRLGVLPRPEPYEPGNYYQKFDGKITLRRALAASTNIVAVKLLNSVGYDHVLEYADRLHLMDHTELQPFPSLALGAPEITLTDMTYAYATFARDGVRYEPRFVRHIMNAKGLYIEKNEKRGEQVISPQNAFLVTKAMREVIHGKHGTAKKARQLKLDSIAGKTGTTNDYTNAWFMGFTPQIAAGAWVGRDLNHTIGRGATGGNTALPIWIYFMEGIKDDLEDKPFPTPEGITSEVVDYYSGKKITRDCGCNVDEGIVEWYQRGTQPTEICDPKDRAYYMKPWYLQKRAYQIDEETGKIKSSMVQINYPSQRRANEYLKKRKEANDF